MVGWPYFQFQIKGTRPDLKIMKLYSKFTQGFRMKVIYRKYVKCAMLVDGLQQSPMFKIVNHTANHRWKKKTRNHYNNRIIIKKKRKETQVANTQVAENDTSHTENSLRRGSTREKVKRRGKSKGSILSRWVVFTDLSVSCVETLHFKPKRRRNRANRRPLTYISALADNSEDALVKCDVTQSRRHSQESTPRERKSVIISAADCMRV